MDIAVESRPLRIALVGVPNCGKTALFNRLTGSRQKVANYPGVTVERREGERVTPDGRGLRVLDLPGTYSLNPTTLDEAITRDVLLDGSPALRRRSWWFAWSTPCTCRSACASHSR